MKDPLIQLAENGWLFVLDTNERNIFKVIYKRLKEVKSQSALISNKEWSKSAGISLGTLIKYRNKLISYGLVIQVRRGGSYVGDANAWSIPSVLPTPDLGGWADLIQNLNTIDDNIYKYINSVQKIDRANETICLERENEKILQLSRNLKRNDIFNKNDVDTHIKMLLDDRYNVEVLLEISELFLNSNYKNKVENIYGFIVDSIKYKDRYFRNQIGQSQNAALIESRPLDDELVFEYTIDKIDDVESNECSILEEYFN